MHGPLREDRPLPASFQHFPSRRQYRCPLRLRHPRALGRVRRLRRLPHLDSLCRRAIVTGQHNDPDPFFAHGTNRFGCRGFDRICNADQSGGRSVHRNEHHGLPQLAESFRFGEQRSGIQGEFSLNVALPMAT